MEPAAVTRVLSIDVGSKNLGLVEFEFADPRVAETLVLKTRADLNIPTYKADKSRTVNRKIYDALIQLFADLKLNTDKFDYIFIEQQMSTNTIAIRIQSILFSYFATVGSAKTKLLEVSSQIKLRRFCEADCREYGIPIKPADKRPGAKRAPTFGSRLTSRNKKKLGVAFCEQRHPGAEFTFDEADALLQAINYLGID